MVIAAVVGATGADAAQNYPLRPVRVVVGFAPAGAPDIIARLIAEPLGTRLGQTIVVDNRPGANGVIGADIVSKSPPDGYTVLVTSQSFAANPTIYRKLPYDPLRDFAPVTNIALGGGSILCVGPQVSARSVEELITLARKPGARISYGSAGTGNTTHLAGALFNVRLGTDMVHVPYKSAGQAIAALMAGEVQVLFTSPSSSLQHIKAGRVRALAYNFHKRLELLPDLPTLEEAGVKGTLIDPSWYGVFAAPKTPATIVSRLQEEIRAVATSPVVRERLAAQNLEPDGRAPAQFQRFVADAIARMREHIKLAGIEPQ
jgi:tripartite-type tricarboxylate transporter receptor subunit TctC